MSNAVYRRPLTAVSIWSAHVETYLALIDYQHLTDKRDGTHTGVTDVSNQYTYTSTITENSDRTYLRDPITQNAEHV